MPRPQKAESARRTSGRRGILAVVCLAVLLAYLGNAGWNLLHLYSFDGVHLLAALTLPVPFVEQSMSRWIEWASAAAFLLFLLLTILAFRAARSGRRSEPALFEADQADIFIADKTRPTGRPAPIQPPARMPVPPPVSDAPSTALPDS